MQPLPTCGQDEEGGLSVEHPADGELLSRPELIEAEDVLQHSVNVRVARPLVRAQLSQQRRLTLLLARTIGFRLPSAWTSALPSDDFDSAPDPAAASPDPAPAPDPDPPSPSPKLGVEGRRSSSCCSITRRPATSSLVPSLSSPESAVTLFRAAVRTNQTELKGGTARTNASLQTFDLRQHFDQLAFVHHFHVEAVVALLQTAEKSNSSAMRTGTIH
jgi:hypothetical protein